VTVVLIVRHGQAAGNSEHRFIGQTDVPLDGTGRGQARALAGRLGELAVARVVSSDLSRAVDTIEPLSRLLGIPIVTDPRLREIDNGEWSGLLPSEIAAGWPQLWEAYVGGADVPRPGGERWELVRQRAVAAVLDHAAEPGPVVICTHGGPGLNIARWALGIPPGGNVFRGPLGGLANASITTVEVSGPRLLGFNDVGHLEGLSPEIRYPFDPVS
jgi:broad specificity phosphatase PhoE